MIDVLMSRAFSRFHNTFFIRDYMIALSVFMGLTRRSSRLTMIDFHNHILPNMDDGSSSLEMSLDMLENASKQGITDVVNTVHYQHPKVARSRYFFG